MHSSSKRKCGQEVQAIIDKYHPIDVHMIRNLTDPPMQMKNLRQALRVLRRKKLVDMVVSNDRTFFYQPLRPLISFPKSGKDESKSLLRRQDWFHNRWCFYWEAMIKRQFSDVEIIREDTIDSHPYAKTLLQSTGRREDVLPDLLLIFPKSHGSEEVSIAFEIERTRKSNERISKKLKTYAEETHIDGVIYICDTAGLAETISTLYENNLLANSQRIRNYGKHFFLFSDCMSASNKPFERLFNADAEPVSFPHWIEQLRTTKRNYRNETQFR